MNHYYFCDTDAHTRQVLTEEENPTCATCGSMMTYGKFTDKYTNCLILKPGMHQTIDGKECYCSQGIVASHS